MQDLETATPNGEPLDPLLQREFAYTSGLLFIGSCAANLICQVYIVSTGTPDKTITFATVLYYATLLIRDICTGTIAISMTAFCAWFFYNRHQLSLVSKNAKLARSEIQQMEKLIADEKAEEILSHEFPFTFGINLRAHPKSIHVAILTLQALQYYEDQIVKEQWNSAIAHCKTNNVATDRRRLIILLEGAHHDQKYTKDLGELYKYFNEHGKK